MYVDRYTVRIQGELIPPSPGSNRQPFIDAYDERRKKGMDDGYWKEKRMTCNKSKAEITILAADKAAEVSTLKKELDLLQKQVRNGDNVGDNGKSKRKLCFLRQKVKDSKKELYFWNRLGRMTTQASGTSTSTPTSTIRSKPTPEKPSALDEPSHIDLSVLMCPDSKHLITFGGTDPGLVTMQETVGLSRERLLSHTHSYVPLKGKSREASRSWMRERQGF